MLVFLLSGCSESVKFQAGDKKDDFCGPHINYMYCKCANHGDFCDEIGMKRGEAKDYVNEKYNEWVEEEKENFKNDCLDDNGTYKNGKCTFCDFDQISVDNKCVQSDETSEEDEDIEEEGECKYDSDCDPICDGEVAWKMGCNARTNSCERTFDTDCSSDSETFSSLNFPKTCNDGVCIRNEQAIQEKRAALEAEALLWSNTVKAINATRDDLNVAMLDANKNCINGIADMTNLAIVEFATRVGSVLAGGIPDVAAMTASAAEKAAGLLDDHIQSLAGTAVDYVGDGLNRLYNYQSGEPAEEEKKLKPDEYIKLNCGLYDYFKASIAESDVQLDLALEEARRVDELLKSLP
ncbi:hypothetical protein C0584_00470 [Candidatus Parcubacteria bacterium]|nr:MAG: hypothetical protein C0584_00470 [Candidatus Parcubacteria bacterium]